MVKELQKRLEITGSMTETMNYDTFGNG